jgi:transposase InsO family protein
MDVNEARRLRALEDENRQLKHVVAHQAVQISILEEVNSKRWLNREIFGSLLEAKIVIKSWRVEYNTERPHSSLGNKTPEEFASRGPE